MSNKYEGHTTEDVIFRKQLNFIDIEFGNELYAIDGSKDAISILVYDYNI